MQLIAPPGLLPGSFLISTLLLLSSLTTAQQMERFGDYEVHYSAVPTHLLDPSVVRSYGIMPSRSTGLLNIAVRKLESEGARAVDAFAQGEIRDDRQSERKLEFSPANTDDASSLIAPFWYRPGEASHFNLLIHADPQQGPFRLKFTQTLFPD